MTTASSNQDFPLAPLQRASWLTLVAIGVFIIALGLLLPHKHDLPASPWLVTPFFVALIITVFLLALHRRRITIEGRELVVRATMYTRRVDIDALDLANARIVDLAEHTEFAPMIKLGGYGLPGFKAGRFLLRNRKHAFCLLTDRQRVLVLPESSDRILLLSPERPQQLLDALNALAAPTPHR
ncbi:PH domain-containing protein [Solilutibacter silvestris]|uniref:Bacterial Pleckstrin homology domain-containing protein n=1 Tax=Solilutibacter silvestris TaxID=1645665 RepID=A0A2K1Q3U3_9GAMM|nr:PH domain-containing protein [Lysobacter silvestris]PNS09716.1 hypothetical protein Lysil_1345 [Lysobacter silvestris]